MIFGTRTVSALVLGALLLTVATGDAHHATSAKFDETKPLTLTGVVTNIDWRNPHVHVFIDVKDAKGLLNWAAELQSPIELEQNGWTRESLQPGANVTIRGIAARNGSRQLWANAVMVDGSKQVFTIKMTSPPAVTAKRPTPRWPDKQPMLGSDNPSVDGYWAWPSSTVLVENGVNVAMNRDGLLKNLADAPKVAPFQPWALGVYRNRQARFLQDDPGFINCKPPGGPRQFQLPEGIQLIEDRERQRIFVLVGGGNNNFRIIYMDGRSQVGSVRGDDDNPLYYGRSVGKWDGDTLVVDTTGFNEDFWFTNGGLPHTDKLRLIERFTRTDYDTLRYEVTIDDVGAYTRPWTTGWTLRWVTGQDMPRHLCQDNRP